MKDYRKISILVSAWHIQTCIAVYLGKEIEGQL